MTVIPAEYQIMRLYSNSEPQNDEEMDVRHVDGATGLGVQYVLPDN